jgi:hypothetical protein
MSEPDAPDFKREEEESKLPPLTMPVHPMAIDDSILMSDRSMVKVNEKPQNNSKGPEQEINNVLQEEIAKINNSLAKISQCLNVRIHTISKYVDGQGGRLLNDADDSDR